MNVKALSVDCYRLLMFLADGIYTHDLLEDSLYQRYVAPVIQEIETNYHSEPDRTGTQPPGLYHAPVPVTAVPPFSGMLRL